MSVIAMYYVGSLPFVLGFLFFWTDMSRGAFAQERLASSAFVLGVLFFWMKFWQAIFARRLLGRMAGRTPHRLSRPGLFRMAPGQIIVQSSALFLLPIALIVTLPLGWVYAFYQNATVLGDPQRDLKRLRREAFRQAQMWPAQNHLLLLFLSIGALFVFLNFCVAGLVIPHLIKTLFGIETVFTRHQFGMLNSTLFVVGLGLTFLGLDPLVKVVYALRCFYGMALETGADLKAELRSLPNWQERDPANARGEAKRASNSAKAQSGAGEGIASRGDPIKASVLPLITLNILLLGCTGINAQSPNQPQLTDAELLRESSSVSAAELDRALNGVLSSTEFSWRLPRSKVARQEERGWLMSFVSSAFEMAGGWMRSIAHFAKKVIDWIEEKLFNRFRPHVPTGSRGTGWMTSLHLLLYSLIALIAAVLAIFALRMWRRRRSRIEHVFATALPAAPDVSDENVSADEFPEENWLKLGRDLMERGESRLALRAFYLAGLAHLGHRELIRIARFKSNRDYEGELRRRTQGQPELVETFSQAVRTFDRVWYGRHEITTTDLNGFQITLNRITTC
jgi:hypothetical protein